MKHQGSLIAVAMLTTYLKANQDYIDLLIPFVLKSLPNKENESINLQEVKLKMVDQYGFSDIPLNLIKKILDRLRKQNKSNIVYSNGRYILREVYDTTMFDKNKDSIKTNIDIVLNSLAEYFNNNTFKSKINTEKATSMFLNFMEYYGYSIIADIDDLRKITNSEKQNYYVARFIIEEANGDTRVYRSILEIVKGFLVYKSIHYFSEDKKKTINSKLKKTDVFIDTKLLLNILGYSSQEDIRSSRELLKLIQESGGKAKIFKHTLTEVAGVLTRYAKDPTARAYMSLDYFDSNGYDELDVLRLRDSLEINIKKKEIDIEETPSKSASTEEDLSERGFIDEVALKEELISTYSQINRSPNEDGIDRDIESISAISRIRGKVRQCYIEDCKAIFVTHNLIINKVVYKFFYERFSNREISFVISEIDLTSLLWLRCFNENSNLPKIKLLENAYSALKPTNELLRVFEEKVILLEKEDRITSDEAILLRTQSSIARSLVDETHNNPDSITDEIIMNVKQKYTDAITVKKDGEIEKLSDLLEKEKTKKTHAILKAEVNCIDMSEKYYSRIIFLIKIVYFALFLFSMYLLVSRYQQGVVITIISLLAMYDLFQSKYSKVKQKVHKLKKIKFNKLYADELKKIEEIFS